MRLKIKWNDEIQGNYEINLNEKIIELLKCVPNHMKSWTYEEIYKDTINYIVKSYSYILSKNQWYDNKQFAATIKECYSLEDTRNKYVYDFLVAI